MQRRRSLAVAVVVAVCLMGASCTDDEPTAGQDPNERLVAIYSATISAVVDDAGSAPADDETKQMVFLQAREETEITAEVQVGVVNDLDEWANVRFIDDVSEAIDEHEEGAAVRDDGVLIGLGPVTDGEASATVVADRWVSEDETLVYDLSVRRRSGEWTVETPIDGVSVRNP